MTVEAARRVPLRIGHRGVSGYHRENSIAAFRAARDAGLDGVELDVHSTVDGELIVHHDPDVPGLGPIGQTRAAALAEHRLPGGERPPTLAEALVALGSLRAWIEVKTLHPAFDPRLLSMLEAGDARERHAVHSFDHRIVARLRRQASWLRSGILSASYPLDPVGELKAAGATDYWMVWSLVDAELVDSIHGAGGKVIAWTVNDRHVAQRLAALGVDGLCGNYPERLAVQ